MRERTCRGYMIQSTVKYIDRTYDEAARQRIYGRLSPRIRDLLGSINTVAWYPIDDVVEIFRAVAAHHRETDGKTVEPFENIGRSIAETATNTFLKLLLNFLTLPLFASKAPDFWSRDHRCGVLAVDSVDKDNRTANMRLSGVKGYDYIGPVAPGFIVFALEAIGCKNAKAEYDRDDLLRDEFAYTFTWGSETPR